MRFIVCFFPHLRWEAEAGVRNLVVHRNVCAPEADGVLCKSMKQHECRGSGCILGGGGDEARGRVFIYNDKLACIMPE